MSAKAPPPGSFRPVASNATGRSSAAAVARHDEESLKPAAVAHPKGKKASSSTTRNPSNSNDSNTAAAAAASNSVLVKGKRLPNISSASDIPFLKHKLRRLKVIHTEADVPPEMRDLNSDLWRKAGFVKNKFRAKGWKPVARVFPFALLDQAKTLTDRMIVVNWWIQQSPEQQAELWKVIRTIFTRPQRSSSPLGKWCALKAAEKEAIRQQERLLWDKKYQEELRKNQEKEAKKKARAEAAEKKKAEFAAARDAVATSLREVLKNTGPAGGQPWLPMYSSTISSTRAIRDWGLDSSDLGNLQSEVGDHYVRYQLRDVIELAEEKFTVEGVKERLWSRKHNKQPLLEYGSYLKEKFDRVTSQDMFIAAVVDMKPKLKKEMEESEKRFKAAQQDFLSKQGMVRAFELMTENVDASLFKKKRGPKPGSKRKREDTAEPNSVSRDDLQLLSRTSVTENTADI